MITCLKRRAKTIASSGGKMLSIPGITLISAFGKFTPSYFTEKFPVWDKVSEVSTVPLCTFTEIAFM